jgi:DNA-binding NtrC family response regulator
MKTNQHKHKLIFIVEDNEMYSFMLDYVLSEGHQFRCIKFEKGEECIKSLVMDPDMIILDYQLPGISGLDTYREIRRRKPATPVVVLTGHYDARVARQFLEEGVYDYILKEENAVQKVKSLVEKVMDEVERKKEMELEKIVRKKNAKIALLVFIMLGIGAGVAWLIRS